MRFPTFTILFLLGFFSTCFGQEIKPYLQTPTPNSVWVNWKTDITGTPEIAYGLEANALDLSTSGTTAEFTDPGYPGKYYYHSVQLTDLQPNTGYYYRVSLGSLQSDVHFFRTPPEYGNTVDKLRILILGDHQIKSQPRYDSLVVAAKRKVAQKYGEPVGNYVHLIMNTGDQVDLGNLDHYENIHFKKSSYISPDIPIMPAVGNHELYGALGMQAYYDHFILNDIEYQGINSNTENYYAYQIANVLFVVLSTEHTTSTQVNWVNQVVTEAKDDENVDWIIAIGHRPYQAEQYVGDISHWFVNDVLPVMEQTEKFVLYVGAHHHIYSRGQFRNFPAYHIISGGTAWNQYWGMSSERDFDETQKTISHWAYQLVEFDNVDMSMNVECYSIGSIYQHRDNELIDVFHRKKGQDKPSKPSITNTFPDSLKLPYTLTSSSYSTNTAELYNSTQFQVAPTTDFANPEIDKIRDFENLYGMGGVEPDSTVDIHAGLDIFQFIIDSNEIVNGSHFARVRHRDRNLEWSDWSDPVTFKVYGSVVGDPKITLDKKAYAPGETIKVTYSYGPGNPTDWVGLYKKFDTPGQVGSTTWQYVDGKNGVLNMTLNSPNEYFAAFFELDGYTEIADRVPFWVGNIPELSLDKEAFADGETVEVHYEKAPANPQDWIGIYKIGNTPEPGSHSASQFVTGLNGTATFPDLDKGYYFATYLLNNAYFEPGERVFFSVGDTISEISTNKPVYNLGEEIVVYFSDGPGTPKDWLGIYADDADPQVDYLYSYEYVDGQPAGEAMFTNDDPNASNILPDTVGEYFVCLFINDSYTEVSNRVYFSVVDSTTNITFFDDMNEPVKMYPNPMRNYTVLDAKYPINQVSLFDIHGREVFSMKDLQQEKVRINRNLLSSGTYILKVYSNKVYQFKLIVK